MLRKLSLQGITLDILGPGKGTLVARQVSVVFARVNVDNPTILHYDRCTIGTVGG